MEERTPSWCPSTIFSHARIKIITGCSVAMYAMEGYILMLLLIDTQLGCCFVEFYQTTLAPTGLLWAVVCQVLTGILVDKVTSYSHRILQLCCVGCLILDPIMFLFSHVSEWFVLAMVMTRYSFLFLLTGCCGKIFKMHLAVLNIPAEDQFPIINNVTIVGECTFRLLLGLCGFLLPYLLIHHHAPMMDFSNIRYLALAVMLCFDAVNVIAAFTITEKYYTKPTEGGSLTELVDDYSDSNEIDLADLQNAILARDVLRESDSESQSLDEQIEDEDPVDFRQQEAEPTYDGNLINTLITIWRNTLVWNLMFQIAFLICGFGIVQFALRFDLAEANNTECDVRNKTTVNFCDNMFTNLLLQDAFNEFVRVGSSIFYFVVLSKMRPYFYFRRFFFILMSTSLGFALLTYWNGIHTYPAISSVVVSSILGIVHLQTTFADSTMKAVIPAEVFGSTVAISGVLSMIGLLSSAGVGSLKLDRFWNTTVLVGVMGACYLWSIGLTAFNTKKLKSLDTHPKGSMAVRKWLYCYCDEK